ncbi:hypothetical protein L227DRAFT_43167 [Lentinus tigrinus ALCF2SS1-6]|uniref:Uncharacterized protein n=1 Tax=Lentinus tigrinus ALCF2SS1-6 TaxID=1328759 RepID=A0A5C2SDT4_9APHY|nr:hypothetical protein L227DRAFT_43167 [Lentinus tigrinus ALCF2SS1-6]
MGVRGGRGPGAMAIPGARQRSLDICRLSLSDSLVALFSCLSRSLFNFYPIYLYLFIYAPSSFLGHLTLIALKAFFSSQPAVRCKTPSSTAKF